MSRKKQLAKSDRRMIFGVCSGIGEYLDMDPDLVRIVFCLFAVLHYMTIFIYILLAAIKTKNH